MSSSVVESGVLPHSDRQGDPSVTSTEAARLARLKPTARRAAHILASLVGPRSLVVCCWEEEKERCVGRLGFVYRGDEFGDGTWALRRNPRVSQNRMAAASGSKQEFTGSVDDVIARGIAARMGARAGRGIQREAPSVTINKVTAVMARTGPTQRRISHRSW
jgi:hypothetical protein